MALGNVQGKPRAPRERSCSANCRNASHFEHSAQYVAPAPCDRAVNDDLEMQADDWAEHQCEQEPGTHEMRLRIAKLRQTPAFKRIPQWKLMISPDGPVC